MKQLTREQKDLLIKNLQVQAISNKFFEWNDASWLCMDYIEVPDEITVEVMQMPVWPSELEPGHIHAAQVRKCRYAPWRIHDEPSESYVNLVGETVTDTVTVALARAWGFEITQELKHDVVEQKLLWAPYILPHIRLTDPALVPEGFGCHSKLAMYRYAKKVI